MTEHQTPSLADLAARLAPAHGYNPTVLPGLRILRSEAMLEDVPVLYKPGAVFVLRGAKQGFLDGKVFRYDTHHYLTVSVPVPFRMASQADAKNPLLAVYLDFDLHTAAQIALALKTMPGVSDTRGDGKLARSLLSSPMDNQIADVLRRLLTTLQSHQESAILGPGLLRELHYRVLVGPQRAPLLAALRREGSEQRIVRSLTDIRERLHETLRVPDLARAAGMSVPSYHAGFKALTGNSPIQYIKAMRLHEARLMIARAEAPIATVAARVGYASPAQFARDFRRHFNRTASQEAQWMRHHLGEVQEDNMASTPRQ